VRRASRSPLRPPGAWARWLAGLLLVVGMGATAGLLLIGEWLSSPAQRSVRGLPPELGAEPVKVPGPGGNLAGELLVGRLGCGAVLLLHPLRADRSAMHARARALHARGYTALVVDLQAHGESPGRRIAFGHREAGDAAAALAWLERRVPEAGLAAVGVSLGGAALVLAEDRPALRALVLESVYPGLREAVENRLRIRMGALGPLLAPLLLVQVPLRLGVHPDAVRPLERMARIDAPVLVAGGTEDRHTPAIETRRLHAAALPPRELWLVPGAAHEDLHAHHPVAWEARVGGFLDRHLGCRDPAPLPPR
jgi:uncharacterized protein